MYYTIEQFAVTINVRLFRTGITQTVKLRLRLNIVVVRIASRIIIANYVSLVFI